MLRTLRVAIPIAADATLTNSVRGSRTAELTSVVTVIAMRSSDEETSAPEPA